MSDFKTERYVIKTDKLAPGKKGPVFAVLADLHNKSYGPGNIRLIEAVKRSRPDAVLVAGDMLVGHSKKPCDTAVELMRSLTGLGFHVFYENGNHEQRMRDHPEVYGDRYAGYAAALRSCGVVLLENEKAVFRARGLETVIYGYEIPEKYYGKPVRGTLKLREITEVLGKPDGAYYNILLAHNPVYFDTYAAWGADLTLSGHLHGGIVRLPGIGGVITPQLKLFPKYDAGRFRRGDSDLVVSRGLGTHTVNIRVFNPPELSIVRITGR